MAEQTNRRIESEAEVKAYLQNMKIIRTEKKLCTCCMKEHDVKEVMVSEKSLFKGMEVKYDARYYYCSIAEELYVDEEMGDANDIRMKDAYRSAVGVLTSEEIRGIRLKYGITQSDLCLLLGWGGKTITRYESHQVQDKAHDTILRKLDQDPEWFLQLLRRSRTLMRLEAYAKYLIKGTELFEKNQDNYLRKVIEARYARFQENILFTGKQTLALDKVVDGIRFFSDSAHVTDLYKPKLMRLLWYADAFSFKKQGHSITGLVYRALARGMEPIGHELIIDLQGINRDIIDTDESTVYRFRASENSRYTSLEETDISILSSVAEKIGGMQTGEISELIAAEPAYMNTPRGEIISYQYEECLFA